MENDEQKPTENSHELLTVKTRKQKCRNVIFTFSFPNFPIGKNFCNRSSKHRFFGYHHYRHHSHIHFYPFPLPLLSLSVRILVSIFSTVAIGPLFDEPLNTRQRLTTCAYSIAVKIASFKRKLVKFKAIYDFQNALAIKRSLCIKNSK